MKFRIELTRRAKADRTSCFDYIEQRSSSGALSWLNAYEDAVTALVAEPHYGEAPESPIQGEVIRQKIFKTRHGRPYRLLYVVREDVIYIIHVRGPGQDVMTEDEVELPEANGD